MFYHPCYGWVCPFQLFYRMLKSTKTTKYQAPSTLLHDRMSARGVMHALHQECVVRL